MPPPCWTGVAFLETVTSMKRLKDMHTLCLPDTRDDRRDKWQTESKNLTKGRLRRMVIGRGAHRHIVDTWEIEHAQELTHALKTPMEVRLPPLADLWALMEARDEGKGRGFGSLVSAEGTLSLRAELQRE